MPTVEKILADMRRIPADVRFAEACRVATHFFGEPRQSGTSHKVWRMPWSGDPRVNMQKGKAKPYQVRQLLDAIARFEEERKNAASTDPK